MLWGFGLKGLGVSGLGLWFWGSGSGFKFQGSFRGLQVCAAFNVVFLGYLDLKPTWACRFSLRV